ncbi:AMP-binding protein [Micromonospora sp. PTRAS2]
MMISAPAVYPRRLLDAFDKWQDRVAVCEGDQTVTFGALRDEAYRFCRVLLDGGLGPGDGVAVICGNRSEAFALRLACHLLGCRLVTVPARPGVGSAAYRAVLLDAQPRLVVVDPRQGCRAASHAARGIAPVLTLGDAVEGRDLLRAAATRSAEPVAPAAGEDDIALVSYSARAVVRPRGACYPFHRLGAVWEPSGGALPDFPEGVKVLVADSVLRTGGEVALMMMQVGCTVVLLPGFEPEQLSAAVERVRPKSVYLRADQLARWVSGPAITRYDISSLRYVPYGNGPIRADDLRLALRRLGPVLAQNYQTSEIVSGITLLSQDDHRRAAGGDERLLHSAGRALPGVEIEIRDAPDGRVGEVWVRAGHLATGYWTGAAPRPLARDGWFRTGDHGRIDDEGLLYLSAL